MIEITERAVMHIRRDEAEDGTPVPGSEQYTMLLNHPLDPSGTKCVLDHLDGVAVTVKITTDEVY